MQPITVTLTLGKETKGTFRYETEEPDASISTLYIRKTAFEDGKAPKAIRIVVEGAGS